MWAGPVCVIVSLLAADPLTPGHHTRTLSHGGLERSYLMHVPPQYDAAKSWPVVFNFHGAVTNGDVQAFFTGMNKKADEAGFLVVYPNGTGPNPITLFWNSGGIPSRRPQEQRDDVNANDLIWEFFQRHKLP